MTGPVEDVRFCPWEGETLPTSHDCIAAQAADARPTEEETP